jgi:hypothetical protein
MSVMPSINLDKYLYNMLKNFIYDSHKKLLEKISADYNLGDSDVLIRKYLSNIDINHPDEAPKEVRKRRSRPPKNKSVVVEETNKPCEATLIPDTMSTIYINQMNKFIHSLPSENIIEIDTIKYPYLSSGTVSAGSKIILNNTKVAVKTIQKIRESDKSKQIYIKKCYNFIKKKFPFYLNYPLVNNKCFIQMRHVFKEMQKKKKYCENCMLLRNHNKISSTCPIIINKNNILTSKIIECFRNKDINENNEDIFNDLAKTLNEKVSKIKTLYSRKITNLEQIQHFVERPCNLNIFMEDIEYTKCNECRKTLFKTHKQSIRKWNDKDICDECWSKDNKCVKRDILWKEIRSYKNTQCKICEKKQNNKSERFQYDHISMFNKTDSICCMVYNGTEIKKIKIELDKCNVVCKPCHDLITKLEQKFQFTRVKQNLTLKLKKKVISEKEYETQINKFDKLYKKKMSEIYYNLNKIIKKKQNH